ncbi:MAG: nucleoside hydrolase [Candidatus Omnitrophica bacterium]|nr:nucleoside hydrolase [Candidatus Omnitrophota bacterium]
MQSRQCLFICATILLTMTAYARVPIIFDTDMGNDIDDGLCLVIACRATTMGDADLLMVGSSNPSEWAVPGMRAMLDYYGRKEVPLADCSQNIAPGNDKFTKLVAKNAGLEPDPKTPDAVSLMRKILSEQEDGSVRIVTTGFSTNMANLLDSKANHNGDGVDLSGPELIKKKVEFLTLMAGDFDRPEYTEYNVAQNVPAFKKVVEEWPTPVYLSGYEIGIVVFSRYEQIKEDLKPENPVRVAYEDYLGVGKKPAPWDRPSWDQTAMLFSIYPQKNYFDLVGPVTIKVGEKGETIAHEEKEMEYPRYYLKFKEDLPKEKIEEILAGWYREP